MAARRVNITHMNISWTKLSFAEAKGFITHYTVSYDTTESRRRKDALVEFVHPDSSYKVIGGLGITTSYLVTVSASTAVGQGESCTSITVNGNHISHQHTRCIEEFMHACSPQATPIF